MFSGESLKTYLDTSDTIKSQSLVSAEWNMNFSDNILKIGNYRYRATETGKYSNLQNSYDELDSGEYYTGATNADILISGGFEDDLDSENNPVPFSFLSKKEQEKMLFSLEDCFGRFRPRSGINKLRYGLNNNYTHNSGPDILNRPRYYLADKNDNFKYWSSFRTESGKEYGISNKVVNGLNIIDDVAPFVVYKNAIPINRVVVKMQTNVGTVDLGTIQTDSAIITDPLFGDENKTTPVKWKVQGLFGKTWQTLKEFDQTSIRGNGSPIIGADGYVEIFYGLDIPQRYSDIFMHSGIVTSKSMLPDSANDGNAFLVSQNVIDSGTYYVWLNGKYETFRATYGWNLSDQSVSQTSSFVTELVNTRKYVDPITSGLRFTEFETVSGLRVVVESMNKLNSSFDLIELSPRLAVDLSGMTISYDITKALSDLGTTGLPVGQLLASTGTLELLDSEQAFNENNSLSLIAPFLSRNLQIKFYEVVAEVPEVDARGNTYYKNQYIPIKTMYTDGFPKFDGNNRHVSINLRDMYLYFESTTAPQIVLQNVSLSYAVSVLLDSIGFSNILIKRLANEPELIIPFFFVAPNQSVAEILQQLAASSQTAMFFDEYNNFVLMSKGYLLPSSTDRALDYTVSGSKDSSVSGIIKNKTTTQSLSNIIDISSQESSMYNDGKINYTVRYIQKSVGKISQTYLSDRDRNWVYKPSLLWEVAGETSSKSSNEQTNTTESYGLSAVPLNSNLSSTIPYVDQARVLRNNIMDFGEAVFWIGRYNGYFYANGEVIRFDAVEYSIPGVASLVWISSNAEYQDYFSKIPFNGKMYPTGRVRIYSEPNYEVVNGVTLRSVGAVAKHGRGQFGTDIVEHSAGLNSYWTGNDSIRGCKMVSNLLFGNMYDITIAGVSSTTTTETVDGIPVITTTVTLPTENVMVVGDIIEIGSGIGSLAISGKTKVATVINSTSFTISPSPLVDLSEATINVHRVVIDDPSSELGILAAGKSDDVAKRASRSGVIKNILAAPGYVELGKNGTETTKTDTVQSSALVFEGPSFDSNQNPINYISYVHKPISDKTNIFKHFGTRMRIVGKVDNTNKKTQSAAGAMAYFNLQSSNPELPNTISGGSGGIGVMVNPKTNVGYYYEIVAVNTSNVDYYTNNDQGFSNIYFYKIQSDVDGNAVPVRLWAGLTNILVDQGNLSGVERVYAQDNQTVYDLAVEYETTGSSKTFYLYLNDTQIATVVDDKPLPEFGSVALFVRGSSRCMFENLHALGYNYSKNTSQAIEPVVKPVFSTSKVSINQTFNKFALSGMIQSSYLAGISPSDVPKYKIYYEEFGTIMREAAYFNIKYDKAYPALYAKIAPTYTKMKGYTVSGFRAGAYGAEFLVFNNTDTTIGLDEKSGNYLRIQGITFTQSSDHELTVDEFFSTKSDFSDPETANDQSIKTSPLVYKQKYRDIRDSRLTYGKKEFSLNVPYIQNQDSANALMSWLSEKIMKPRKSVGLKIFANPTIQLGDIVNINYVADNINAISTINSRFVVYNIKYSRSVDGPSMELYLSEVGE